MGFMKSDVTRLQTKSLFISVWGQITTTVVLLEIAFRHLPLCPLLRSNRRCFSKASELCQEIKKILIGLMQLLKHCSKSSDKVLLSFSTPTFPRYICRKRFLHTMKLGNIHASCRFLPLLAFSFSFFLCLFFIVLPLQLLILFFSFLSSSSSFPPCTLRCGLRLERQ